jgi:hypothetical protein
MMRRTHGREGRNITDSGVIIDVSVFDGFLFDLDGVITRNGGASRIGLEEAVRRISGRTSGAPWRRYRAQSLIIELEPDVVRVQAMHCEPPSIRVAVNGEMRELRASETRVTALT